MADTFFLQVVSPERVLVEDQATEAQIPALDGYIGVLPGAAPLLSELKPGGVMTYRTGGQEKVLAVYGGFVEVLPDRVRVLADFAEHREDIDLKVVPPALAPAAPAMTGGEATDPAVALAEIMRTEARTEAANRK